MTPRYAELDVTTNFSFLRGGSHAEELVATAKVLGLSAIAVTDRNTLAGVVRAHLAAREVGGIKFIVGARLDLDDAPSLLAYPTDRAAYGKLCRLLTLGQRRAEKGKCTLHLDDVAHAEGLIFIALPPAFAEAKLRLRAGRLMGRVARLKAEPGGVIDAAKCPPPQRRLQRRRTSPQGGGMVQVALPQISNSTSNRSSVASSNR
jgi:DNA polymerase III alpha subunit